MSDLQFDPHAEELYEATQIFDNQVMKVNEVANYLKCSTKKIYQLVSFGKIPHKKIGRQIRFHLPEIKEWLKGG